MKKALLILLTVLSTSSAFATGIACSTKIGSNVVDTKRYAGENIVLRLNANTEVLVMLRSNFQLAQGLTVLANGQREMSETLFAVNDGTNGGEISTQPFVLTAPLVFPLGGAENAASQAIVICMAVQGEAAQ